MAVAIMQRIIKKPNLNSPIRSFQYLPINKEIIFGVNEYLKESLKSSTSLKIRLNRNLYTVKALIINKMIIITSSMNFTPSSPLFSSSKSYSTIKQNIKTKLQYYKYLVVSKRDFTEI